MVTRAIFVLLSALAGMALFLRAQDPSREFLLMGLGMGGWPVGSSWPASMRSAGFHSALLSAVPWGSPVVLF
jgi:hypothetical protein